MDENEEHIRKKMKIVDDNDQDMKPIVKSLIENIDTLTISRICARCRLDFVDERHLRSHFLRFRNQASFSCELCHKSYMRADILQEHQRVHLCENLYKCVRCFYSCNQIYDIYEHMHSVHKVQIDQIFKCPYDDITFRNQETLFSHIACHRIRDKSLRIETPTVYFDGSHALSVFGAVDSSVVDASVEKEKSSNDFDKTQVGGAVDEKDSCKKEKVVKEENASDEEEDRDDILPSTLLECNLDTAVLDPAKQMLHLGKSEADQQTNENQSEKSEGKVPDSSGKHAESKSNDGKGQECAELVDEVLDEIDQSTLIDMDYVKNDMVINTENYSHANSENDSSLRMLAYFKNIKCAYCMKVFIMKNDLKNHLVVDHDLSRNFLNDVEILNKQKFECPTCKIQFDFAIDLTHHTTREHTEYKCATCSKVYHQAHTLKKHEKSCRPVVPQEKSRASVPQTITCHVCDKNFKRNWNLKQHMQNIHKITSN